MSVRPYIRHINGNGNLFSCVVCFLSLHSDQKIMNELLIHEGRLASGAGPSSASAAAAEAQCRKYSSSSEEEGEGRRGWGDVQANPEHSEESSDEEFTMKVCEPDSVLLCG